MKAFVFLNFLFGGVVFAVGFGPPAAGVSVTSYFMHLLPRWMAVLGMIVAIAGEFSSLSRIAFRQTSSFRSPDTWASSGCSPSPWA